MKHRLDIVAVRFEPGYQPVYRHDFVKSRLGDVAPLVAGAEPIQHEVSAAGLVERGGESRADKAAAAGGSPVGSASLRAGRGARRRCADRFNQPR